MVRRRSHFGHWDFGYYFGFDAWNLVFAANKDRRDRESVITLMTCRISRFAGLGGFNDSARAEAAGADFQPDRPSLFFRLHLVKIGVLDFLSLIIGVAYMVPKGWAFSADITYFRHENPSV